MIQVLRRAFTLLEIVSSDADRDWPVGELAERLSINQTTCTNIVRSLLDLGYLEEAPRRRGYRLGAMAYNLSRHGPYKKRLVDAARQPVEALVRRVRETALVSVLRRYRKVVLFQVDRDDAYQLRRDFVESRPPFATATGRVLVAHLSSDERESLLATVGPPGEAWDGIETSDELLRACDETVAAGHSEAAAEGRLMGIGVPVFEGEECAAALGMFMPIERYTAERREIILREMKGAAAQISDRLS